MSESKDQQLIERVRDSAFSMQVGGPEDGRVCTMIDMGSSLVLHLAIGWWIGFLVLVRLCGLHMSPPREDGWAGMIGLVAGLLLFCGRNRLGGVAYFKRTNQTY